MTACEKNCNPISCPETICEPGIRSKFNAGQIAKGCPVKEFRGNGDGQPIFVVTACRKETEEGIQRCLLPCPVGKELDFFFAEKNN